jgi:hypothetical protein
VNGQRRQTPEVDVGFLLPPRELLRGTTHLTTMATGVGVRRLPSDARESRKT